MPSDLGATRDAMYLRICLHACKLSLQNKNVNRRIMMTQSPTNQGLNFAMKQLSGQDDSFLEIEDIGIPQHVESVAITRSSAW